MENLFTSLEQQYGLPTGLLSSVQSAESGGDSNAVSPKGAKGNFQFMPDTAKAYGVDTSDPVSSAHGAAKYLSDLTNQYGSVKAALAHWNGGTKAGKAVANGDEPPAQETQGFLQKVSSKLPIDETKVKWDSPAIDESQVKWDEPSTQQEQPKMSNAELALGGAKKAIMDIGHGAHQLVDLPAVFLEKKLQGTKTGEFLKQLGEKFGMPTAEQAAAVNQAEIDKEAKDTSGLMQTLPGQLGYMGGNLAAMTVGGGLLNAAGKTAAGASLMAPQTMAQAIGGGAAMGALQPTTSQENELSRPFNILAGGALGAAGQGLVEGAGRIAQPVQSALSDIGQKAVQTLRDAGVPLDAVQATGSKLLGNVKAALNDNFLTAGGQAEFAAKQKAAYNQAIAKTMGEDSNVITPSVIEKAQTRIGKVYEDVLGKVNIDAKAANKSQGMNSLIYNLSDIRQEAEKVLADPNQRAILNQNIDNIFDNINKNNGEITGASYKNIKKILDKFTMSNDPAKSDLKQYAGDIKDALHGALRLSAENANQPELVQQLKQADKQWGNMRKIEDVALKSPEGDVSPSLLYNSLTTKKNRNAFYSQNTDLADLATAGKMILPEKIPNSGTATRLLTQQALKSLGAGAIGSAIGYNQGDTAGAVVGGLGAAAAPLMAQKVLNNPAAISYLEKGVQNTPLRAMLQLPGQVGAGRIPGAAGAAYLQNLKTTPPRIELNGMANQ